VVDAKHLVFPQHVPQRLVDGAVRLQVMAQGFSSTTRVAGPFRPTAAICSQTVVKRLGAVATYITSESALRALITSASRP
jgi:hypothetical protein